MDSTAGLHHYASSQSSGVAPPGAGNVFAPDGSDGECLVILDPRALDRQCLSSALVEHEIGMAVAAMGTMEDWRVRKATHPPLGAILYNLGSRKVTDPGIPDDLKRITSEFKSVPLVILADTDDCTQILAALECGARGYIPSSVGVEVCVEAINLAVAGGIFVPASSVLSMRHLIDAGSNETKSFAGMFTQRQAEVAQALRRGKANKIIAYELKLRESTVKVHIRNIMKKLKATNRTEVAFKLNDLFSEAAIAD
jgi:DNA-binding NarL/FixJ family response regulator